MRWILVLLLVGCASTSQVTSYGEDSYVVSATDPGGVTVHHQLLINATRKASAFCTKDAKTMSVKESKTSGDAWAGRTATVVFRCVEKSPLPRASSDTLINHALTDRG